MHHGKNLSNVMLTHDCELCNTRVDIPWWSKRGGGVVRRKGFSAFSGAVLAALVLAGCAVSPQPFGTDEHAARAQSDLSTLFADQEVISGPISLAEATSRALKYNLDQRLKVMEEAVAYGQLEVANLNLLPAVTANAGYDMRNKADSTFNEARTSTSTTSERQILTSDLHASWNVLDFGIGYLRARQQADLALIVEERRRQVIHTIMQETRAAYYRAAAAERALGSVEPLLDMVRDALMESERAVQERVGSQIDALVYQRSLLETLRQLETLRRDLLTARTELAVLMNIHPASQYSLIDASAAPSDGPLMGLDMDAETLERLALINRSELRSEAYQLRINQEEARVAILQMIPGLNFSAGVNRTSDQFKLNQQWYDASLQLTWNLMNIVRGPANIRLAETQQELSQVRRLALTMAVIAQVNVAQLRFETARRDYELASRIAGIESRIRTELDRSRQAQVTSELELIQGEVALALADLRRDLAFADMQASYGRIIASLGLDPTQAVTQGDSIAEVTEAVEAMLQGWERGEFPSVAMDEAATPVAAEPAPQALPSAPEDAPAPEAPLAALPRAEEAPMALTRAVPEAAAEVQAVEAPVLLAPRTGPAVRSVVAAPTPIAAPTPVAVPSPMPVAVAVATPVATPAPTPAPTVIQAPLRTAGLATPMLRQPVGFEID